MCDKNEGGKKLIRKRNRLVWLIKELEIIKPTLHIKPLNQDLQAIYTVPPLENLISVKVNTEIIKTQYDTSTPDAIIFKEVKETLERYKAAPNTSINPFLNLVKEEVTAKPKETSNTNKELHTKVNNKPANNIDEHGNKIENEYIALKTKFKNESDPLFLKEKDTISKQVINELEKLNNKASLTAISTLTSYFISLFKKSSNLCTFALCVLAGKLVKKVKHIEDNLTDVQYEHWIRFPASTITEVNKAFPIFIELCLSCLEAKCPLLIPLNIDISPADRLKHGLKIDGNSLEIKNCEERIHLYTSFYCEIVARSPIHLNLIWILLNKLSSLPSINKNHMVVITSIEKILNESLTKLHEQQYKDLLANLKQQYNAQ